MELLSTEGCELTVGTIRTAIVLDSVSVSSNASFEALTFLYGGVMIGRSGQQYLDFPQRFTCNSGRIHHAHGAADRTEHPIWDLQRSPLLRLLHMASKNDATIFLYSSINKH
jgi:hypothetical protein